MSTGPRHSNTESRRPLGRRLWSCLRLGVTKGAKAALWLLAIMVPVSFAVKLLAWTGALGFVARGMAPAFDLFGLPGEAAVALLSAMLLNIYVCIAAAGMIPLTDRQVTILALMALVAHALIIEGAVQRKAGTSAWRMTALRLVACAAVGILLNMFLPADAGPATTRGVTEPAGSGFGAMLAAWALGTAWLVGKVTGIVVGLMVLQRMLDEFGVTRMLARVLYPVLWLLGLPRRAAFLWIVANTLGLAYGAAVIVERAEAGDLPAEDGELLHRSIAVCHSLLEDTLLWVAVGAWALWITLPRVALAAAVVWSYRAWRRVRGPAK